MFTQKICRAYTVSLYKVVGEREVARGEEGGREGGREG